MISETTDLALHLIEHKVIAIDSFVSSETGVSLHNDLTQNTKFEGSGVEHKGNWMDFKPAVKGALEGLSIDLASKLGVTLSQFEPWEATKYSTGGMFDYHSDCKGEPHNERLYTICLIVCAPDFGGSIHFPQISKSIQSKLSRLIIWRNLDKNNLCDPLAEHAVMPVGQLGSNDEQMIITTWIRLKKYVS